MSGAWLKSITSRNCRRSLNVLVICGLRRECRRSSVSHLQHCEMIIGRHWLARSDTLYVEISITMPPLPYRLTSYQTPHLSPPPATTIIFHQKPSQWNHLSSFLPTFQHVNITSPESFKKNPT
ncbi:uncharacterized protein MYCFIDRAFT_175278 [Pseudocercospora fijiensis CIRAD86]|uniref:Uncharacterized protein n=1 Tax=Pseudocercospora fijiensis (strain CIRAD86) TaxID=383855 RepID=M3AAT7_PSEFD|nr:uncharacterized protein MYCFIDRAFT_175278 [Pseudocercospora fijiensis CIRAD86]EME81686.1 hypothetical protein MYCFIDRAFT_175278 [Pseudocercospora fijiensis CIRAD86]